MQSDQRKNGTGAAAGFGFDTGAKPQANTAGVGVVEAAAAADEASGQAMTPEYAAERERLQALEAGDGTSTAAAGAQASAMSAAGKASRAPKEGEVRVKVVPGRWETSRSSTGALLPGAAPTYAQLPPFSVTVEETGTWAQLMQARTTSSFLQPSFLCVPVRVCACACVRARVRVLCWHAQGSGAALGLQAIAVHPCVPAASDRELDKGERCWIHVE